MATAEHDERVRQTNNEIIRKIADNYIQLEKAMVAQLRLSSQHHLTTGSFREEIWKNMFEQIVPRKFSVEQSVFIIDSNGNISNEVDLAIFDEQYTPYIFRFGKLKYIPIEAVAVVVQCKSKSLDNGDLKKWVESIQALKTSNKSITRTQGMVVSEGFNVKKESLTQTSTRPLRILCHLNESYAGTEESWFDFVIAPKDERLKLWSLPDNSDTKYWYKTLNHAEEQYNEYIRDYEGKVVGLDKYVVSQGDRDPAQKSEGAKDKEVTLLTLTFQLNQLLMLLNNPMFFPHLAYVEMFNKRLGANPKLP
ncbi:DUF6602 domain-containing protein [Paenibacillus sp. NPDC058071]|uniref:DUF6602 domain-containing protein n=1 Tax=Paenibacillus sp. NPDC058071 TaxID=3346326 RepID=UPI0036DCFAB7